MADRDLDVFWRELSSSEGRPTRVLIRVFLPPGGLGDAIAFYEDVQDVAVDAIFPYPEAGLRLATVGGFLLIEGSDELLAPFTSTTGTLLVDDARPYYDRFVADDDEIVVPWRDVPTGAGFTVRHPDGTVVEYVHHRPTSDGV